MNKTVHPIHFEDFSGPQFERLIFSYHARSEAWHSLEWYGQLGSDHGRDIICRRLADRHTGGHLLGVQCANWRRLTTKKAQSDIDKIATSPSGKPDSLRVITGGRVSAKIRDSIKSYAATKGISHCEVWSGNEFEEMVRAKAESLLARFVHGEEFPDAANDLSSFAWGSVAINDQERLARMSMAFDRPAFQSSLKRESSLPAFCRAIDDTIMALNTGVLETRDGVVIRRIPCKGDIRDDRAKAMLFSVVEGLAELRSQFDDFIRSGEIEHCKCGDKQCPTYMMTDVAATTLTLTRNGLLRAFDEAKAIASEVRKNQSAEEDDEDFFEMCKVQGTISGTVAYFAEPGTQRHRWAERMVDRGRLIRCDHGGYEIRTKRHDDEGDSDNHSFLDGSYLR